MNSSSSSSHPPPATIDIYSSSLNHRHTEKTHQTRHYHHRTSLIYPVWVGLYTFLFNNSGTRKVIQLRLDSNQRKLGEYLSHSLPSFIKMLFSNRCKDDIGSGQPRVPEGDRVHELNLPEVLLGGVSVEVCKGWLAIAKKGQYIRDTKFSRYNVIEFISRVELSSADPSKSIIGLRFNEFEANNCGNLALCRLGDKCWSIFPRKDENRALGLQG
ncbi:hypothetical protein SADUNF_Sadunf01G0041500 [Salix dunnii]|uniref:Uncharacterized protein n=1 Tax=Salix dunnii TaxID=1413687 RepID=A0A835TL59_9ROSI|nr:hypothetical protein SADUNF_Sadunf01G0041500 [Salix dunnii]